MSIGLELKLGLNVITVGEVYIPYVVVCCQELYVFNIRMCTCTRMQVYSV